MVDDTPEDPEARTDLFLEQAFGARPAGPAGAPSPPLDRQSIGPYQLLQELGRGGQGVVYLAEDSRLRRRVALKVLTALGPGSENIVRRFRREAEVASRLQHPGICAVHDAGVADGLPYIAMQFVPGETLARMIAGSSRDATTKKERPPSTSSAATGTSSSSATTKEGVRGLLELFEKAARALHAAHEAGVIHRDVKPGNIMVTPEGQPVILDFGLARSDDEDFQTLTRSGELFGTPAYMSPEQLHAGRVRLDRRTDVYSLGVALFEALTLRRPFEAPTRAALHHAIQTKEPPDPRRLNPAVSADLAVVLGTVLEKDRDRRYQTAQDFAEELRRVRVHEPIVARPIPARVRLFRWAQRNPALATAVAALFLALAAGLAVTVAFLKTTRGLLKEVEAKAAEAQTNLADWERLADGRRLEDLLKEADGALWPAVPEKVPAIEKWLRQARDLLSRLDGHRQARDELRPHAKPDTDGHRHSDRAAAEAEVGPKLAEVRAREEELRKDRDAATGKIEAAEARLKDLAAKGETSQRDEQRQERALEAVEELRHGLAALETQLAGVAAERADLEQRLSERRTWVFDDARVQLQHDKIADLVEGLETLKGEPRPEVVTLRSMEARLAAARTLGQRSVAAHAEAWQAALARVAANPAYRGLTLPEQVGLVPLGSDPNSNLEEFSDLGTGEAAVRGADGKLRIVEATGVVFVLVPGGTFLMGAQRGDPSAPNYDPQCRQDESPVHQVTLAPFFLSKYEMTQGQWSRFTGINPSFMYPGSSQAKQPITLCHPVESVSWTECQRVLRRLGFVLPTEAQWEYACRAGTGTPWWSGAAKETLADAANLMDNYLKTHGGPARWVYESWSDGLGMVGAAGSLRANSFGLHDTLGNVWEWCRDGYGGYDLPVSPGEAELQVRFPPTRISRGGSWGDDASSARVAMRNKIAPEFRSYSVGVRPARRINGP